jgi:hypothetical protein
MRVMVHPWVIIFRQWIITIKLLFFTITFPISLFRLWCGWFLIKFGFNWIVRRLQWQVRVVTTHHEKRLDDLLFMNGLVSKCVPADGNCFFQSELPYIHSLLTVQELRRSLCDHILNESFNVTTVIFLVSFLIRIGLFLFSIGIS